MEINSAKVIMAVVGLWIVSMVMLNLDQLTVNSALLVSLITLNIGWTLKLNNDMNRNHTDIRMLMQRMEDHLNRQDDKGDDEDD